MCYKWLCWTEYYGLLQSVVFDGIMPFIRSSCFVRNMTVYYKKFLDGMSRCFTNVYVGRYIKFYYKWLFWTECYGVLQVVVIYGILRCITNRCVGRNITVYYK